MITLTLGPADDTVEAAEHLATSAAALGPLAAHLFGLFLAVGADAPGTVAFERKLRPEERTSQLKGRLLLRKWLFAKGQEAFIEDDEACVDLLTAQVRVTRARLQSGVSCSLS